MIRALIALVVLVGLMAPALADKRDDAKREFAAGLAADRQKDFLGAIDHYLKAYELVPHPFALYNIAVDYEELGNHREAARYYKRYIDSPEATDRQRVAKLLAALEARAAPVVINSDPAGARVTIDNVVVGTTPHTAKLKGGHHEIVVDRGTRREAKTITIEFGEPQTLEFSVGAQGTLFVDGTPVGASVLIDGEPAGEMPVQLPLDAGTHRVSIRMDGFTPVETTATVTPGMVTRIQPVLTTGDAGGRTVWKLSYLLGGGAGADVTGNGVAWDVEFGLRGKHTEVAFTYGQLGGASTIELVVRYAFLDRAFTPIVGGGFAYVGGRGGYEVVAGLRYELMKNEKVGIGLLAMMAARIITEDSTTTDEASGTSFFPFLVKLQIYYR